MSNANINEQLMKSRGESKVWNSILKPDGKGKDITSTQIGQQLLFDEALRILPTFNKWVSNSNKSDRLVLRNLFSDDDKTIELLLKTLLFLSGGTSGALDYKSTDKKKTRHKKIKSINEKVFDKLTFEQTWRIVEVIVDMSKFFQVTKEPIVVKGKFNWSLGYICTMDEAIFNKLSTQALMAFYPMPMTEKPKDWSYDRVSKKITGGYHSYQYEMVRTDKKFLRYGKFSQSIYDSLNYIQGQPWRINKDVLRQIEIDLRIPVKEDFVKNVYPDAEPCRFDIKINEEGHGLTEEELNKIKSVRKDFQQNIDLYLAEVKDFESAMGKYRAVKMAIEIANKYKDEVIYFPHSYDSRGRIYPLPVGLSPQGSDAVKAMLEYADGEVLNRDGASWAFAYLASLYGDDKLQFEDRVERGMELIDADYRDADEPYQFLAHQIELRKVVENPKMEFKGRIHLDACNSGSQFTSALTNDLSGCLATNVIPTYNEDGSQKREDAYLLVAEKATQTVMDKLAEKVASVAKDEVLNNIDLADNEQDREVYEVLLNLLKKHGRKICKRPVMVSNYGGTAGGRADMLYDMFRELNVERKYITQQNAIKFAKIIGDSITGVLNGGKAFEKYIQTMNNLISKKGTPVYWSTSDGFHVVHVKYKELKPKKVSLLLPNARRKTTIMKKMYSDEVAPMKMRSAISPNYIHSLDAELLRRTALRMKDAGIESSDWIHDSFGCLPNQVGEMLEITKEVFLDMMNNNPLVKLDLDLRTQAANNGNTDRQISKVVLPNLEDLDSFRDVSEVLKSDWFFS